MVRMSSSAYTLRIGHRDEELPSRSPIGIAR